MNEDYLKNFQYKNLFTLDFDEVRSTSVLVLA